jgi:photosystem II stability/assembly factor-like uncharacterized protein
VSSIRFANTKTGWAFGSALWVTHDGGQSWRRDTTFGARSDQAVNQIFALEVAAGSVYTVVHKGEGNGCTELDRSPIDHDDWTPVRDVGGCGVVLGAVSLAIHGHTGSLLLQNGGRWTAYRLAAHGWSPAGFPCPNNSPGAAVAVASDTVTSVECMGGGAAGNTAKQLFLSRDAGRHYVELASGLSAGGQVELAMTSTRLVLAASSAASWIYRQQLNQQALHKTLQLNDGGLGWREIGLTTATQGFAIEGAQPPGVALYITRDGGTTWHKASFPRLS